MPENEITCPNCDSTDFTRDKKRAEIVCKDCGCLVDQSIIDPGPEWRAFEPEEREEKSRSGGPLILAKPDKGLTTQIDRFNIDGNGNQISQKTAKQMSGLRRWHQRASISSSLERNLKTAFRELRRITAALELPNSVAEETAKKYRKIVKEGLTRGRLIEEVLVATLYIVCRKRGIPRTLKELSEVSGVEETDIGKTYRFLKDEMDIDVPLADPMCYVPRFASKVNLSGEVQEEAKRILEKVIEKGLISGKGPTGVAAASLYIAAAKKGERRTQKQVAEAAGITEVTIRNRYQELKKEMDLNIEEPLSR